jgi:RNA polymerase sigma-70 factor (ECF subfamily)
MITHMTTTIATSAISFGKQDLVRIYEQHSPGLYRYAYRLLGDPHLSEECVSETFSRLLQAVRRGQGPNENVQGYLYRVAHNWITDHYRRRPHVADLDEELHVDPLGNPADALHRQMESTKVRAALLKLPDEQRKVILMRVLEDWSHEQVAAALGKTVEASRALQHRALASLRRLLVDQQDINL